MKVLLLSTLLLGCVVAFSVMPRPPSLRTTMATACGHLEVPPGTQVEGGDWQHGGDVLLRFPNNTQRMVKTCRTPEEIKQLKAIPNKGPTTANKPRSGDQDGMNQWLAWYFGNYPTWNTGGTSMSAYFTVPPLPSKVSNLAIFPGLQPTYDPTSYDFILQPVLSIGAWMDWTSYAWVYRAVTCISSAGYCIYAPTFGVKPGEVLYGGMDLVNTTNGQSCWVINATSTTSGKGNTISYCTKYMITFAFTALEHNPAGPIGDCKTMPSGQVNFTDVEVQPGFIDGVWQGTLGDDASCGIAVDTFPSGDSVITF